MFEETQRSRAPYEPALACVTLPPFDATQLDGVRGAFASAARCELGQAWQAATSPRFAPAVVRFGWSGNVLLVYAELTDADIFTRATELNQRLWELGDSFEIFLRPEDQEAYVELQVAPNNQRLQLRYANIAALDCARQTGRLTEALLPGDAFLSRTWIEEQHSRWHVLAGISTALVCGGSGELSGRRWRFSFSRYDYTRGEDEPVISSSSAHAEADFHRQHEWGQLYFTRNSSQQE